MALRRGSESRSASRGDGRSPVAPPRLPASIWRLGVAVSRGPPRVRRTRRQLVARAPRMFQTTRVQALRVSRTTRGARAAGVALASDVTSARATGPPDSPGRGAHMDVGARRPEMGRATSSRRQPTDGVSDEDGLARHPHPGRLAGDVPRVVDRDIDGFGDDSWGAWSAVQDPCGEALLESLMGRDGASGAHGTGTRGPGTPRPTPRRTPAAGRSLVPSSGPADGGSVSAGSGAGAGGTNATELGPSAEPDRQARARTSP
jgi:hypothetical protein